MSVIDQVWQRVRRTWRKSAAVAVGLCRELSDEGAYARHLAIHGRAHSPDEWRRFSDARLQAKFARGRCC